MPPKTPRQSGASLTAVATPNLPTYSFGDIVLAKVKGHPAWPARIVDPYVSPLNLRDERKIAQKNSYLVKFFKTADYAWMNAKEISMLDSNEIQAFINNPNKKGADLKAAYQIALAPEAWEAELEARLVAAQEDYNALEIDELDTADAEGADQAASAQSKQKRKRPSETKSPAMSTKKRKSIDARASNASAQASATPEPPVAAPAVKKRGKKKEEPIVPVDGESVVREWRHRLQRLFLGKVPLTEKMMPEIDDVFTDIEKFEMKTEWLTSSKLAKVLKRVGVLEEWNIPLDAQYSIRARARALQEKWRNQLGLGEEPAHRTKTADGNEEVKVNASADDGNGKENTDPTGTKKAEEVAINGKEPTKPSDPDSMDMDEDQPISVKVGEVDETNKAVEPAPLDDAQLTAPQTEAPGADVSVEPKSLLQANGNHQAVNGQPEPIEAESEAANAKAEAVNGEAEAVNGVAKSMSAEPEAINAEPETVNAEIEAANVESEAIPEAVNPEPETVNPEPEIVNPETETVNPENETVNPEPETVNGQPDQLINDKPEGKVTAVSAESEAAIDESKTVNGDHASLKEDESTKAPEKPDGDVEMVTANVETKSDEKATSEEPDDDDQQMDCADTPEPTPVENSNVDKEKPV